MFKYALLTVVFAILLVIIGELIFWLGVIVLFLAGVASAVTFFLEEEDDAAAKNSVADFIDRVSYPHRSRQSTDDEKPE